jgi:3-methyladenine DNA glycosylase AlkD
LIKMDIKSVRDDLMASADEKTRASAQRFFKEQIKFHGVKSALVARIAAKHWTQLKLQGKRAIFDLCEKLLASGYCEEAFIVSNWLPRISDDFQESDLAIFEKWIDKYIDNWAKCDSFCNHTMGDFFVKFPGKVNVLKKWAKSENRWVRRAAAVSLIVPAKKGLFLKDAFEISDIMLLDKDDMVQKGYGWLLKEESRTRQQDVFQYVLKNKANMPRTALRYAIELMPENLRKEAMQR